MLEKEISEYDFSRLVLPISGEVHLNRISDLSLESIEIVGTTLLEIASLTDLEWVGLYQH